MILLPLIISLFYGILLLKCVLKKTPFLHAFLFLFLAMGLGMGLCAQFVFYSFVFFHQLHRGWLITVGVFYTLMHGGIIWVRKDARNWTSLWSTIDRPTMILGALVLALLFPLILQSRIFPYGGWDAWEVWNFKSKFLLEGGNHWRNMFDPSLWRTSPHYPLLLPCMNVWGWLFTGFNHTIPSLHAILMTILTAGILCFSILLTTQSPLLSAIGTLAVFSIPYGIVLATSQYADILVAFYLLGALVCLVLAKTENKSPYAILGGISVGFLSFTKPEGTIASLLIVLFSGAYLNIIPSKHWWRQPLTQFIFATLLASLSTVLFQLLYSPGNQTFINGFLSENKPAHLMRWKYILSFTLYEFIQDKWNGLWILGVAGLFLSRSRCWGSRIWIVPAFLLSYLGIILLYYQMNTYFEITWWLQVTWSRILFTLSPTFAFWVAYSLKDSQTPNSPRTNKSSI